MNAILEKIETLPPLPQTIREIEQLFAHDSNPKPSEVVAIIEKDPLMTAQILARANSAFYSFRDKISTLQRAVALIGVVEIKNLLYEIMINQTFQIDLSPYGVTPKEFAQTALLRSRYYRKVATKLELPNVPAYSTLVFLLDVGKILIAQEIIAMKKKKAFQKDLQDFPEESSVEILHLNITTLEVDLYLFNKWNFDVELLQTLRSIIQGELRDMRSKLIVLCYKTFSLTKPPARTEQITQLAKEIQLDPDLLL